jgi:hypothetical protein
MNERIGSDFHRVFMIYLCREERIVCELVVGTSLGACLVCSNAYTRLNRKTRANADLFLGAENLSRA